MSAEQVGHRAVDYELIADLLNPDIGRGTEHMVMRTQAAIRIIQLLSAARGKRKIHAWTRMRRFGI